MSICMVIVATGGIIQRAEQFLVLSDALGKRGLMIDAESGYRNNRPGIPPTHHQA